MSNRHNYSKHYSQEISEVIETPKFEEIEEIKQEESKPLIGEVSVEKLNIRSTPSSDNNDNIVKELAKSDVVEIVQDMGKWYQVCTATGVEGYVMSEYIKVHV